MTCTTIQKIDNLNSAHEFSSRSDGRDRVRFDHPSGDRWASLRFPTQTVPEYMVFIHSKTYMTDNGWLFDSISRRFTNLCDALDYLYAFIFPTPRGQYRIKIADRPGSAQWFNPSEVDERFQDIEPSLDHAIKAERFYFSQFGFGTRREPLIKE